MNDDDEAVARALDKFALCYAEATSLPATERTSLLIDEDHQLLASVALCFCAWGNPFLR